MLLFESTVFLRSIKMFYLTVHNHSFGLICNNKFRPDRFSRFDVFLDTDNKQTDKQNININVLYTYVNACFKTSIMRIRICKILFLCSKIQKENNVCVPLFKRRLNLIWQNIKSVWSFFMNLAWFFQLFQWHFFKKMFFLKIEHGKFWHF